MWEENNPFSSLASSTRSPFSFTFLPRSLCPEKDESSSPAAAAPVKLSDACSHRTAPHTGRSRAAKRMHTVSPWIQWSGSRPDRVCTVPTTLNRFTAGACECVWECGWEMRRQRERQGERESGRKLGECLEEEWREREREREREGKRERERERWMWTCLYHVTCFSVWCDGLMV